MITNGWDDSHDIAWHIVKGLRVEWEYEGDKKQAVADIAQRLQEAYKVGMDEAMRFNVPQKINAG